jgi:CRISPR-associated protein Csm2
MANPSSKKVISSNQANQDRQLQGNDRSSSADVSQQIITAIEALKTSEGSPGTFKDYSIRELVKHAQEFGPELKRQRLETNQVRKFLDAINQIKARLPQIEEEVNRLNLTDAEKTKLKFTKIEVDVVLLKPKLAYAAARQDAVKSLNQVMSKAIDKVHSEEDFDRLVQFMEAIIAYHKAEGGK